MKTFNMDVNKMPTNTIGFGGENDVTEVVLDFTAWAEEFGQGAISLLVKRAMDTDPYPAVLITEGTTARWIITDVETSYKGHGEAQWIYTVGEQIKKSAVFGFNVDRSLNSPTIDTPEAYQTWVDDMIALGAGVAEIAEQVFEATGHYPKVENGYWYVWSVVGEEWVNTNQKAQGEQGIPGVGISSTVLNADYTLTITFTDGSSYTTPPIKGEKGDTGNGISSTVLNADYTLTITFTNGTTYTTPSIRGVPGQDYVITSADYDEIAGRVDTMIDAQRQQALDDINGAKTNAVSDVTAEGTTQKGLVTSEGTTQKGLVTSEGTTQVGLVTAKGQEVIQSIPSDYSELSDDVSELKSDLTNKADIIINSASGAIASFSDGANYPVKQTVFSMNPVQDLHGQEYPYPAGGAGNKLPPAKSLEPVIVGEMTITPYADGHYRIVKTAGTSNRSVTIELATAVAVTTSQYFTPICTTNSGNGVVQIRNASNSGTLNNAYIGKPSSTMNSDGTVSYIHFYFTSGMNGTFDVYPMITDTAVSSSLDPSLFRPYSNICPIIGYDSLNAYRTGHNVWDEQWELGGIGTKGIAVSATDRIRTKNYIPIVPNTTYYAVFPSSATLNVVAFYDANKNYVGGTYFENAHRARTTPANAYFMRFQASSAYGTTYNHDISINYPATDTDYHAYTGDTATYNFSQTVYDGVLTINEYGSGQIVSKYANVDLGTLNWSKYNNSLNVYYARVSGMDSTNAKALSSVYPLRSSWVSLDVLADKTAQTHPTLNVIYVRDDDYSTYASFKASVTGQQLVYELAEPVTINLTEQEVIDTLYGNNNLWHDANGNTTITYRADTKAYVDGLVTEDNNSIIAPIETGTTASQAYAVGKYFLLDGKFCKAKTSIASGATFTLNTNYEVTTVADELYTALHS